MAWEFNSRITFLAEASTHTVGMCLDWLKSMHIIDNVECSSDLAKSVPDTSGCYFVPAFSGLAVSQVSHIKDRSYNGIFLYKLNASVLSKKLHCVSVIFTY